MSNILENQSPLTPEDQFLLELLVDGELEDPERRDLLLKLNRIPGGWRCCAAAFLEAQCISESLKKAAFPGEERLRQTVYVSVRDLPDPVENAPFESAPFENTTSDTALKNSPFAQNDPLAKSDPSEKSRPLAASAAEREAEDPLIIPIQRGGFTRGNFTRRGNHDRVESGISRRALFGAAAGGFLVAVLLTGFLAGLWRIGSGPSDYRVAPVAAHRTPNDATFAADSESNQAPKRAAAPKLAENAGFDAAPAIRHVTLKSPRDGLDGISVPCVESDRYDPTLLDVSSDDQYADRLRQCGHRVETVSEQLMFPLEDGRMLIVPVDTINVQYKNAPKPVIYQ